MTDSNKTPLRQLTGWDTKRLVEGVRALHVLHPVTCDVGGPRFNCSCGMGFPVSWPDVNKHFYDAIGEAAEAIGAVPHPSWGGFAQPEADAPAGSPDWTGFGSEKSAQAMALIADLSTLLKSASYPEHVGTAALARADAFLQQGDDADPIDPFAQERLGDPGPAIGGAFEVDDSPETEALRQAAVAADQRAEGDRINHEALRGIVNAAVDTLDGFASFALGYLAGNGFSEGKESLEHILETPPQ